MAQLRQDYQEFINRQAEVVVIGPDDQASFVYHWKQNDNPFIGLPDPDAEVLTRYGQEVNLLKLGRMPAQALIDKNGVVKYVHYGDSMSDIPRNPEILTLIDMINLQAESSGNSIGQTVSGG